MSKVTKILFLSSSPKGTPELEVIRESEIIIQALERSRNRDNLDFYDRHLATFTKLQRALLDFKFDIVHISGHGTKDGPILEKEDGSIHVIPSDVLSEEFEENSPPIQCVILNACYGSSQGDITSMNVPFTVVMENKIDDIAALEFSRGFYDAIGAKKGIVTAYNTGNRAARALGLPNFKAHLIRSNSENGTLDQLFSQNTIKRVQMVRWLGATQQENAVPAISNLLKSESDAEVRYWSILALSQISSKESLNALAKIEQQDPNDRFAIEDALLVQKL